MINNEPDLKNVYTSELGSNPSKSSKNEHSHHVGKIPEYINKSKKRNWRTKMNISNITCVLYKSNLVLGSFVISENKFLVDEIYSNYSKLSGFPRDDVVILYEKRVITNFLLYPLGIMRSKWIYHQEDIEIKFTIMDECKWRKSVGVHLDKIVYKGKGNLKRKRRKKRKRKSASILENEPNPT